MNVRKPLYALGLLSLTTLLTVGVASPAGAAETCQGPPGPQTTFDCFTMSTEAVTIEQPVTGTTTDTETFSTRVIVEAPSGITFDQTVSAAADSTSVDEAIATANASAIADGLSVTGTSTSTPQRTLVDTTQIQTTTLDREEVTVETVVTFGPDTIQTGPNRSETLTIPAGATNYNTITTTTTYLNVTTNTTNTYLTTATVTITAVAPASPTSTTTTTTAPAPAVAPTSTDTSSGELARTGTSNAPWAALGISLVLVGAGCVHLSRRAAQGRA